MLNFGLILRSGRVNDRGKRRLTTDKGDLDGISITKVNRKTAKEKDLLLKYLVLELLELLELSKFYLLFE